MRLVFVLGVVLNVKKFLKCFCNIIKTIESLVMLLLTFINLYAI